MNANSSLVLDVLANDIIPVAADTVVTVSVNPVNGLAAVSYTHLDVYKRQELPTLMVTQ